MGHHAAQRRLTLRPPLKRTRKGDYALSIPAAEREVLRQLPAQLRELLASDDPSLRRLYPPAYPEDDALEAEYRQLMSDDLLAHHAAALDAMEATVDRDRLTEEEVEAWLGALNQLRLVLGTRLDVSEELDPELLDPTDPRHHAFALYQYLTWLQEEIVGALSA